MTQSVGVPFTHSVVRLAFACEVARRGLKSATRRCYPFREPQPKRLCDFARDVLQSR